MSFEANMRSDILVAAEIRRCEVLFLSAVVVHKGDQERGQILIKQYVHGQGAKVFTQSRDMDGKLSWHQPLGGNFTDEAQADGYISRQRGYDEDLWVIEVDDPKELYSPNQI
ncbi:MAG: DUF1491 family protein [Kordiimonadaceae bacterium]|jgi:hypothetical protein|nr:DUF1491 family protein [Kordiimonadaceae bacterium]MBT6036066.1 DUF1491 family protein [Kordiimonadaceae bacterium]MBT6330688.1 DUF1491 family protein [Kordiimonadaceae bacterium]MBT7583437.1 DUF1491 family protein [Kordiimonadaceae bacterium]